MQLRAIVGPRRRRGGIREDRRPVQTATDRPLEVVHPPIVLAGRDVDHALTDRGRHAQQRFGLGLRRGDGRHWAASVAQVKACTIGRHTQCAAEQRVGDKPLHLDDLEFGGLALIGVLAHHVEAHRCVPHVAAEVEQRAPSSHRLEVLPVGLEVPVDTCLERGHPHVLDLVESAHERSSVGGFRRCDAVAAIAGDDARDTVPARRAEGGIPQHLWVVVGMDVDEAGRDHQTRCVDLDIGPHIGCERDDAAVTDTDVETLGRRTGAIEHCAAAYCDLVCHHDPLGFRRRGGPASRRLRTARA